MHQASFTVHQKRQLLTVLSREPNELNEAGARRLVLEFRATPVHGTAELGQWLDQFLQNDTGKTAFTQGALDW